jgi:hypothetical protein
VVVEFTRREALHVLNYTVLLLEIVNCLACDSFVNDNFYMVELGESVVPACIVAIDECYTVDDRIRG